MAVKSYKDLEVWQLAMDLAENVYTITKEFPREEIYGLTSQLRRAAVSIPSNIAEGQGRKSTKEFLQFLSIAYGSLCEVETQLLLSVRLGYVDSSRLENTDPLCQSVGRMLNGLMRSLRTKLRPQSTTPDHRTPTTDHRQQDTDH